MDNYSNESHNMIETLVSIFTVEKGEVKILLFRKKDEPYKGYWTLPGNIVKSDETLEENINNFLFNVCGLDNIYLEQSKVFSKPERLIDKRVVAVSFIGLIDVTSIQLKEDISPDIESDWFSVSSIPKMAYDHEEIIVENLNQLRNTIVNSDILKILFPSDFTLPELQSVYEQILDKELDRRNFRKKFINFDLIEDTGYKNEGYNGRPAKLYRFKEKEEDIELF